MEQRRIIYTVPSFKTAFADSLTEWSCCCAGQSKLAKQDTTISGCDVVVNDVCHGVTWRSPRVSSEN